MNTIKNQITLNKYKLAEPDVLDIKNFVEPQIYNLLLAEIYNDFRNAHKFLFNIDLDIVHLLYKAFKNIRHRE